jgi:osmotically-inducible protein OsmY
MKRSILLMLIAVLPLVQGCVPLVVGGAAATGVAVAQDRRTAGTMAEDEGIEAKASGRIRNRFGDGPNISVTSYNRSVLLTGQVADAQTKSEAERIVRGVENVRTVLDELTVGSITSFSSRSNDALITSKVKARFLDAQKFNVLNVKVVTENGTVYLLGLVSKQEANDASDIARTTSGVQKVVRVFEYID